MRGQAFDVFKLVIAAAVGMIILGLLLSILGGIRPPGGDPVSVTQNLLRDAYFQGIQRTSPSPVTFTAGTKFNKGSLVSGTGIPSGEITIGCPGITGGELDCPGDSVEAIRDITVKVVVNCLSTSTPRCTISYESAV